MKASSKEDRLTYSFEGFVEQKWGYPRDAELIDIRRRKVTETPGSLEYQTSHSREFVVVKFDLGFENLCYLRIDQKPLLLEDFTLVLSLICLKYAR